MTQPASVDSWRFRPDIEGLRAIAIVGVILYHAGIRTVSGGFLGVDVFFVLSGFLITGILIEEVRKTGTVSLAAFWTRRARRLLPAATLVSLVTLVLSASLDSPFAMPTYAKSAIAFATYWSNLLLMRREGGYFDQGQASDPFLHTWSLAVEEQYYLVFAPLVLLLAWMVRARGFASFRRRLLVISVAVTAGSFVGALLLTAWKPIVSFYGLPSRAWEFGMGTLLAIAGSRGTRTQAPWNPLLGIGALGVLIASWFIVDARVPHPGAITLLPVLATSALIHLGGRAPSLVGRLLEARPMLVLGQLSYSWYLWHWPITVYWTRLVPEHSVPLAIGMPIVSLMLAQLTYVVIESRARRSPTLENPRFGLPAAAVMAVFTIAGALAVIRRGNHVLKAPENAFILEARNNLPRIYADGCHLNHDQVVPQPCIYGRPTSDTTVVLFGDSHAAQWFPPLEGIALARGWRLITMTKSACPVVSIAVWSQSLGREYTECERWRTAAVDRIATLKPRIVFVSNSRRYSAIVNGSRIRTDASAFPALLWKRGLLATLDRLPRTAGIMFMEDTPSAPFDVPTCLIGKAPLVDRCAFPRSADDAAPFTRVEREAEAGNPRVMVVNPADWICDGPVCPAVRNAVATFTDSHHLSVRFSTSLSLRLQPILDSLLASRHTASVRESR